MEKHISWRGSDTDSLERCHISVKEEVIKFDSTIVAKAEGGISHVSYQLTTTPGWIVKDLVLEKIINNETHSIHLQRNGDGEWSQNGHTVTQFNGVDYLDISLTPLTNSLPINHLNLQIGKSAIIVVVYIDVLANNITKVKQKYTRLGEFIYRFENVPNDFEATITVDGQGLVTSYPGLFESVER